MYSYTRKRNRIVVGCDIPEDFQEMFEKNNPYAMMTEMMLRIKALHEFHEEEKPENTLTTRSLDKMYRTCLSDLMKITFEDEFEDMMYLDPLGIEDVSQDEIYETFQTYIQGRERLEMILDKGARMTKYTLSNDEKKAFIRMIKIAVGLISD